MKNFLYKDELYSGKELAAKCGIKYTTFMERIKRGYTVEEAVQTDYKIPDSIKAFDDASNYFDWNGMTNAELYDIYRKWCMKEDHKYPVESDVHFGRSIRLLHPNIRIVPTRLKRLDGIVYKRVIRVDGYSI